MSSERHPASPSQQDPHTHVYPWLGLDEAKTGLELAKVIATMTPENMQRESKNNVQASRKVSEAKRKEIERDGEYHRRLSQVKMHKEVDLMGNESQARIERDDQEYRVKVDIMWMNFEARNEIRQDRPRKRRRIRSHS